MKPSHVVVLIATVFSAGYAFAQFSGLPALTGQFTMTSEATDPPPGMPLDSHLQLILTGESAKSLFDGMKVETIDNDCEVEGPKMKRIGSMLCTMPSSSLDSGYMRFFAIDIANQKISGGWGC